MYEPTLYDAECFFFALIVVGVSLYLLVGRFRRSRPELTIWPPVAVGLGLKVVTVVGLSLSGFGATLRGGDEVEFVRLGRELAGGAFTSEESLDALSSKFHVWLFSLQFRLFDFPEIALRVVHVGLAVAGLVLIIVAVHDLAGARPAILTAWLFAFEPASTFFSSVLHKESLMMLAAGLVVFGGARLWSARDFAGLPFMAIGCTVAVVTRPYAGWFLVAAAGAVVFHASLTRRGERQAPALVLTTAVALVFALALPTVLAQSSNDNLDELQASQEANARNESANLSLERVDYSTRAGVVTNLPRRIRDVVFRPYPWQVENLSQQLGVLGTLVTLALLFFLARVVVAEPRAVLARAGPLVYPAFFLLIAYALSAGNAGTGFRYRTQLVTLAIGVLLVLREHRAATAAEPVPVPEPGVPRRRPLTAPPRVA